MPRRGRPTPACPAGDQSALVERLALRHPITVCEDANQLTRLIRTKVEAGLGMQVYDLNSDVPRLVAGFLAPKAQPEISRNQPSTTLRPNRSARS
jgi:hypothetical protein